MKQRMSAAPRHNCAHAVGSDSRIPTRLGSLLLAAQALLVAAIALSVDTDARICATMAHGDLVARSIDRFIVDYGRAPNNLSQLVPHHLAVIPDPDYGVGSWDYTPTSFRSSLRDQPVGVRLPLGGALASAASRVQLESTFSLGVRVDPNNPSAVLRREAQNCWVLPESPLYWSQTRAHASRP
jgi:hypothetical protein